MPFATKPWFSSTMPRVAAAIAVAASVATLPVPASAQDSVSEARIRKIEAEIRALQRNVFPGGDGRYFEPQIAPGETATQPATTTRPSTTAVTDILARLDAMEQQLQRLTSMAEENTNLITQFESRLALLEASPGAGAGLAETVVPTPAVTPVTQGTAPAKAQVAPSNAAAPAVTGPSAERLAAVQAIAKPQTDDAADDEYSYGFRLWEAKLYPEAQQQLTMFVEQNPNHWRATYGRNLLGRAYLDDGKAKEAAPWFLKNYQDDKTGARAGDSLLYLAESMIALNDTRRACIALAEFAETYPALASGRLQGQYDANRGKVKCN